jgi:hypothetical protein
MKLLVREAGLVAVLVVTILALGSGIAWAQLHNGQENAVILLHAQTHNTKGLSCGDSPAAQDLGCETYTKEWPLNTGADVFMIVAKADSALGISGVSCGIKYSNIATLADGIGVDVFGYTFCSDLEYTNSPDDNPAHEWPYSGGGNRLIWVRTTNCQRHVIPPNGVHVTACIFYCYAYGPDKMEVDMNRNLYTGPEIQMVDCPGPALSDIDWPYAAGKLAFGIPDGGYNPCTDPIVAVERSTWGKLKNQYRN